ncbi:MAG TPA: hypothetical protein VIO57_10425, partial [Chloroflexota bacterium]
SHEGGTAPRGWNRFYFEPYPERVRGFLDLITHPAIVELAVELFGEDYRVVELGSDIPLPGAVNQLCQTIPTYHVCGSRSSTSTTRPGT